MIKIINKKKFYPICKKDRNYEELLLQAEINKFIFNNSESSLEEKQEAFEALSQIDLCLFYFENHAYSGTVYAPWEWNKLIKFWISLTDTNQAKEFREKFFL